MERIGNLYEKICSMDNLILADENARKNKTNSYGVKIFDKDKDGNLNKLHDILINKTYKTSGYSTFTIHEPKERLIYRLPYFPDRILHHAVMNILEPIWCSIFTKDTYSCIKNRGIEGCRKAVVEAMKDKENCRYCLKTDIHKFYPSIDHDILKSIIRKKIKDKDLLDLLDEVIDSAAGVPIGNYLSQFFANVYLTYLDHYVKEVLKVKYYFRYADDMVIFSNSKKRLHDILCNIKLELSKLKLTFKPNHEIFLVKENRYISSGRGLDFVGYVFYHSHTMLRKRIKKSFCRKISEIRKIRKSLSDKDIKMAISPWLGWCKHCDSTNLVNTILKTLPYEIKLNN